MCGADISILPIRTGEQAEQRTKYDSRNQRRGTGGEENRVEESGIEAEVAVKCAAETEMV